jgi:hypothetical protein
MVSLAVPDVRLCSVTKYLILFRLALNSAAMPLPYSIKLSVLISDSTFRYSQPRVLSSKRLAYQLVDRNNSASPLKAEKFRYSTLASVLYGISANVCLRLHWLPVAGEAAYRDLCTSPGDTKAQPYPKCIVSHLVPNLNRFLHTPSSAKPAPCPAKYRP